MPSSNENISVEAKMHYDKLLSTISKQGKLAINGMEKIVEQNISMAKAQLALTTVEARDMMYAKNMQEYFSLLSAHAQDNIQKTFAYDRQVVAIASSTLADIAKEAEDNMAEIHFALAPMFAGSFKNLVDSQKSKFSSVKSDENRIHQA